MSIVRELQIRPRRRRRHRHHPNQSLLLRQLGLLLPRQALPQRLGVAPPHLQTIEWEYKSRPMEQLLESYCIVVQMDMKDIEIDKNHQTNQEDIANNRPIEHVHQQDKSNLHQYKTLQHIDTNSVVFQSVQW